MPQALRERYAEATSSDEPEAIDRRAALRGRLLMIVSALAVLGLVMVCSTTGARAAGSGGWAYGSGQAQWLALGVMAMLAIGFVPLRCFARMARPLAVLCLLALAAVCVPGVGTKVNGAYRWFRVGGVNVQPSELAKFGLILLMAWLLARVPGGRPRFFRHVVPLLGLIGLSSGLIVAEPDLGTAALIGTVLGLMLLAGGAAVLPLAISGLALAVPAAFWGYDNFTHLRNRLGDWLDGTGFHTNVSMNAIGSGGWFGVGLGQGPSKLAFLPEAHTDFIFAMIGQELGLFGTLSTVGLFAALAGTGLSLASDSGDRFARLTIFGVTMLFGLQAAFNMGVVTGLLPPKGIQLPFVSYGGSGLCVNLALVGLMLSASRVPLDAPATVTPADVEAAERAAAVAEAAAAPAAEPDDIFRPASKPPSAADAA